MERLALFTATRFIYKAVFQVVIERHSTEYPSLHTLSSPSKPHPPTLLHLLFCLTPPFPQHTYIHTIPHLNPVLFPIQFHPAFFSASTVLDLCPNWFEAYLLAQMHAKFDSLHSVVLLSSLAHSLPLPHCVLPKLLFSRCNEHQPKPSWSSSQRSSDQPPSRNSDTFSWKKEHMKITFDQILRYCKCHFLWMTGGIIFYTSIKETENSKETPTVKAPSPRNGLPSRKARITVQFSAKMFVLTSYYTFFCSCKQESRVLMRLGEGIHLNSKEE